MALFEKREEVFSKQDKALWLAAREALKAAGIRGIRARHCDLEPPACGCGAKLDIRDFGPKGKIDRETYFLTVPMEEAEKARAVLEGMRKEAN